MIAQRQSQRIMAMKAVVWYPQTKVNDLGRMVIVDQDVLRPTHTRGGGWMFY